MTHLSAWADRGGGRLTRGVGDRDRDLAAYSLVNSYFLSLFPCVCLSLFHVLFVPISLFLFFLLLFFLVTATKASFRLVPTTVVAYVSVFLPLRLTPSLCLSSPSHPLLSLFFFPSARCNQGLAVVPVCALSLARCFAPLRRSRTGTEGTGE